MVKFVFCWWFLQTVWNKIRPDRMSGLIWIQAVWHSDVIPEKIFWKKWCWKMSADEKKVMKNYLACRVKAVPKSVVNCITLPVRFELKYCANKSCLILLFYRGKPNGFQRKVSSCQATFCHIYLGEIWLSARNQVWYSRFNSYPLSATFIVCWYFLQTVWTQIWPYKLFDTLMVFLKEVFQKANLKKKWQMTKSMKNY